jgi:PAS domain S-box-containing protein
MRSRAEYGTVDVGMADDERERLRERISSIEADRAHLRERLQELARVAEHAPDYIIELDRKGIVLYMNRVVPGHTMADMLGSDVRIWMRADDHPAFERTLQEVFVQGNASSYESVGSVTGVHYTNRVSPVTTQGTVSSAILITHDVSALKASEVGRRELEHRYRALVDASFDGLVVAVRGVIVEVNASGAKIFGRTPEEILGKSAQSFMTPESFVIADQKFRSGSEEVYELRGVRADGSIFPLQIVSRNVTYQGKSARVSGLRDLTTLYREGEEQARREEQVRRAQKLETLGVLAGGIAHDFNNLLAVVLANTELLARTGHDPTLLARGLDHIRSAATRGSELVEQLLSYAGRKERSTQPIDLNALISDTTELLRVSISKKAQVEYLLDPELPSIEADAAQLQQVLMNLITNASDALGSAGGTIGVRTGLQTLDAETLGHCIAIDEVRPGTYAALEVIDNGCGMEPATIQRMFDPFFSTKFTGRGLGLASVLGIVRSHRGAMSVQSTPAVGTRFCVYLPVASSSSAGAPAPHGASGSLLPLPPAPAGIEPLGVLGTILLAEDEPLLAQATKDILELERYRVLVAGDGVEALELYRAHAQDIVVALLDVTMPRMDGRELAAALRAIDPRQPIVLMSGYVDEAALARSGESATPRMFLRKPYRMDELLDAIRQAAATR